MNEKDWHILLTIYEERSITKAAERLYISQPALTYRLQQLEKEFDTTIVARRRKGVEFTSQGEYLVEFANNMVLQLRKAKEYIHNMDRTIKGTLRLGVSGHFARYELPTLLKKFLCEFPNIEINLKTGWSSEINQMLHKETVHLGIVRDNYNWHGHTRYLLRQETICIASSKKVELEELPRLPRINYLTDPSLKNVIDNWWQETFTTPPTITMEVDRVDTCKQMVINGLGYAIFPSICLTNDESLYTFPIITSHNQPLLRSTWIVYRDNALELSVVKTFIDFLKKSSQEE